LVIGPRTERRNALIMRTNACLIVFETIVKHISTIHRRMPNIIIVAYYQITALFEEIGRLYEIYDDPRKPVSIITLFDKLSDLMLVAREVIENFWKKTPEIALTLPSAIVKSIITVDLCLTEDYLRYAFKILSEPELPIWLDPVVVEKLNEARERLGLNRAFHIVYPEALLKQKMDEGMATKKTNGNVSSYTIYL
jgi:hypothetical protein